MQRVTSRTARGPGGSRISPGVRHSWHRGAGHRHAAKLLRSRAGVALLTRPRSALRGPDSDTAETGVMQASSTNRRAPAAPVGRRHPWRTALSAALMLLVL